MPSRDTRSVVRMFDEVTREYSIDRERVYLTGLSDGGIFTYILGLEQSELFRGLAPVAGALHLVVDRMLREGRGKDTPMLVIHGVHDFIFPVTFTRQTCNLLKQIGYNVNYEELPDWGHAYPVLDQRAAGAAVVRVAASEAASCEQAVIVIRVVVGGNCAGRGRRALVPCTVPATAHELTRARRRQRISRGQDETATRVRSATCSDLVLPATPNQSVLPRAEPTSIERRDPI